MPTKVNHDKIAETAEGPPRRDPQVLRDLHDARQLHELAQAFAAVVDASPSGWFDTGRKVTVR